jgi:hypothetical protein
MSTSFAKYPPGINLFIPLLDEEFDDLESDDDRIAQPLPPSRMDIIDGSA